MSHVEKLLRISKDLTLPLDTVTQTFAILARKRSGKSFTAKRIAEQMFKAGLQVVALDPKGDWWGLRSAADGKAPGLAFLILGGEHGDLPLEVNSGELVAKLVVEERVSVVLDLSLFRKHEIATFVTGFAENLYRLKALERFRTPMMLLIDEADAVAPQKPAPNEARMLGAIEDIVRRGGQRGIGCGLVTQRSAVLNKNVLTQVQILVAMQTIAPQDLKAMEAWIDVHGTAVDRLILMESLPALPQGDAWFWSPGWPTKKGIFERVHVLPIETFDSGATPKVGEKPVEPKEKADVDLEALKRQMAATIERAAAQDPRALQRKVAELQKQLEVARKAGQEEMRPEIDRLRQLPTKKVEVPVIRDGQIAKLEKISGQVQSLQDRASRFHSEMLSLVVELRQAIVAAQKLDQWKDEIEKGLLKPARPTGDPRVFFLNEQHELPHRKKGAPRPRAENGNGEDQSVGAGEMKILVALAKMHPDKLTRVQLGIRSGYAAYGSTFRTYVPALKRLGWVDEEGGLLSASALGLAQVPTEIIGRQPDVEEVRQIWRESDAIGAGEWKILQVLIDAGGGPVSREVAGERSGYEASGSTFRTYAPTLKRIGLATESKSDGLRAAPEMLG